MKKLTQAQGESGKADMSGKWEVESGKRPRAFHLLPSTKRKRAGFTLIELIGVMAIIGILAAVTLPSMISRIETANTAKEDANLEEIGRALVAGIKATGTIPNPTAMNFTAGSWTAIALNYTALGQTNLASVLPANNDRQIILSANLATYVAANGYTTPAGGWPDPLPSDLKIYILASSKNGLPLQASIPVADIANWTKVFNADTGTVAVPASVFGSANTTKGEFLHVKVVDLNQLFCRVELTDTAAPENIAGFAVSLAGTGYPPSSTVNVNFGNNTLAFATSPSGGILTTTVPALSSCADFNTRHGIQANNPILPGTALFDAPSSPNTPTYDLISTTAGSGTFSTQTIPLYVIKGRPINLFNAGGTLDKSVVIQSDVQYRYFNNSWTRVD